MIIENWGLIGYEAAWDKQTKLFEERLQAKANGVSLPDIFIFCEHPHVYTLGKSGAAGNLLIENNALKEKGVEFFHTDRGGDITYHGPGQIVCYPILDLEHYGLGLRSYISKLEEAVILFLEHFGVKGERLQGATGVWLEVDTPGKVRKICAIGVRSSRFITMHGLALNINTDLSFYQFINPCGFTDKGVTSLEKETSQIHQMDSCLTLFSQKLEQVFK